jgi:hypothetical protein
MRSVRVSLKPLFLLAFCLVITSCQIMHVAPTYQTPCFTDRNQFEGSANIGATGLNAGLAYSPVKYLSLQASGLCNLNSTHFNNQLEGGIGGYLPVKSLIIGINAGYGIGSTNYQRWSRSAESYNYIQNGRFDTKKYFGGFYVAYRFSDSACVIGLSFRKSFYEDFYYATSTLNKGFERYNYSVAKAVPEINFFNRIRTGRSGKFYLTINCGFVVFPRRFDNLGYYPTFRIGYLIKL